jgi:hypothetical protein
MDGWRPNGAAPYSYTYTSWAAAGAFGSHDASSARGWSAMYARGEHLNDLCAHNSSFQVAKRCSYPYQNAFDRLKPTAAVAWRRPRTPRARGALFPTCVWLVRRPVLSAAAATGAGAARGFCCGAPEHSSAHFASLPPTSSAGAKGEGWRRRGGGGRWAVLGEWPSVLLQL